MQPPPYSQLARQFLELWQNQMSSVLNDREFIHSMVEMMQAMGMPDAAKAAEHAAHPAAATVHASVHLTLFMNAWISSTIASACLKNALPPSSPGVSQPLASALEALPAEVSAKAHDSFVALLEGIRLYQSAEYERTEPEAPTVWRQGPARLLAYYPEKIRKGAPTVLFIPSLINRYYILDLAPKRSFAKHLAEMGIPSLVLDWGTPGKPEAAYDSADYVQRVLLPALRFVYETSNEPVVLAGYCMGGVFALAAALLAPECTRGLALFATPWDFHAKDAHTPRLDPATLKQFSAWINELDMLPPSQLQLLFYWNDPWLFSRKFTQFAELKPGSKAFREFMELEYWVNDGVPLSRGVTHDCLIDWGQHNMLVGGGWRVNGEVIDPKKICVPSFAAVPRQDRIVPQGCALPLAQAIPGCDLIQPTAGHVGMIVGSKAKAELWEPFTQWLMLHCST